MIPLNILLLNVSRQRHCYPLSHSLFDSTRTNLNTRTRTSTRIASATVRYILSCSTEVPINSKEPERPCRIILAEDLPLVTSLSCNTKINSCTHQHQNQQQQLVDLSWKEHFSTKFPLEYGISFDYWSTSTDTTTMSDAIQELKTDLQVHQHDTIFIARGPWISWLIQYYIEDLSLNGLVLIDPIPFNDNRDIYTNANTNANTNSNTKMNPTSSLQTFEQLLFHSKARLLSSNFRSNGSTTGRTIASNDEIIQEQSQQRQLQQQYDTIKLLFNDYVEHWDHWALKLEPGSVPIMILSTDDFFFIYDNNNNNNDNDNENYDTNKIVWKQMAEYTANRHSDTMNMYSHHGNVPIHDLCNNNKKEKNINNNVSYEKDSIKVFAEQLIHDWIMNRVL